MAGAIDQLIVNKPYEEPTQHWRYEPHVQLREDYRNGRSYYPLQGAATVHAPTEASHRPDKTFLDWHNAHIFRD